MSSTETPTQTHFTRTKSGLSTEVWIIDRKIKIKYTHFLDSSLSSGFFSVSDSDLGSSVVDSVLGLTTASA